MGLSAGTKLGPYEIEAPLGAGGMGEVYRARDTRLERTVAIKVLNSALIASQDLKARFEREAKSISQLNHPNICTLYDVGQHGSTDYLVMELIEGESLADRLKRGPLGLKELVSIGRDIADALDRAHRAGIVHRDLKPGNVMLTKSGAKLLDFGLAKPVTMGAAASSGSAPLLSAAMTMTSPSPQHSPLTQQGALVGTVQYMSPEQIQGMEADARSDIFALGAMLYEMATGKRAFEGKSQISIASAILEKDPDPVSALDALVPQALDRVIATCLAKDRCQRWQSAFDVKLELGWALQTPARPHTGAARRERLLWSAALITLVALSIVVTWIWRRPTIQPVALNVAAPPEIKMAFNGLFGPAAVSPDGTRIAIVGTDKEGVRMLFVRGLGSTTLQPLPGTTGASYPFWSSKGNVLAFFANDRLKTTDGKGGAVSDLCAVIEGRGGAWNERGDIVFGTRSTGLFRITGNGGTPIPVTTLDRKEVSHRFPTFLPGGDQVAFVAQTAGDPVVKIASLHGGGTRVLSGVTSNVAFAGGRIFHVLESSLLAQSFDPERLSLGADKELIAKPVAYDGQFNYAAFSVVPTVMAYEEGSGLTAQELVEVDQAGKVLRVVASGIGANATASWLHVSGRGNLAVYAAAESGSPHRDAWAMQLANGAKNRISLGGDGGDSPIVSYDGARVAYVNSTNDELFVRDSDGTHGAQRILKMAGEIDPVSFTPDGKFLLFDFLPASNSGRSQWELYVAAVDSPGPAHLLMRNIVGLSTALSADGKWLAYGSDESGRREVYVTAFDPTASSEQMQNAGRWQISIEGGTQPRWSRKGDELFFSNNSLTTLFRARVKTIGARIESNTAEKLFDLGPHATWGFYDSAPNGHLYMFRYTGHESSPLAVLLNWERK